jgi:hypothetical protein
MQFPFFRPAVIEPENYKYNVDTVDSAVTSALFNYL